MKMKINKACDLNSISVLPPHNRRSQPSTQQSFSQAFSSQPNGIFSQNSQDESLLDNQRFGSQEKDTSIRRMSCLAPGSYPREDSQLTLSRSSSGLTRRWSSVPVPDHKCQLNDELDRKITAVETSISRFAMILDSVQADVLQISKGTKELLLEVVGLRQKSTAHDDSLHLLNRGQDDIRATHDVGLKSISGQLSKVAQQENLELILSAVSNLPGTIQKHYEELYKSLSRDLQLFHEQAINCSLTILNQKDTPLAVLPPKVTGESSAQEPFLRREAEDLKIPRQAPCIPKATGESSSQKPFLWREAEAVKMPKQAACIPPKVTGASSSQKPFLRREAEPMKESKQARCSPKVETGRWTTVKSEKLTSPIGIRNSCKNLKQRRTSPMVREQKVIIELEDSDEEISCFIVENGSVMCNMSNEVDEATRRILMKARRRKRKSSCRRSIQT